MKNMDRRLKRIIFLLITMLLTLLFLLLYTIYSYKYAYVNGNVIKADDDNTLIIYEGHSYDGETVATPYNVEDILPGDSILDKKYCINVNYNGDVYLLFRVVTKDENNKYLITPPLDTQNGDISPIDFLSLFDVNIKAKSINKTVHEPEEPETPSNAFPTEDDEGINFKLSDLSDNFNENVIYELSSDYDTEETIEYYIKITLSKDVDDNFTSGLFNSDGNVVGNTIQGHKLEYTLEWSVDTEKPDPHHDDDDDDDDDHGGEGHLIPVTGIFGLRLTKKQTTYLYFILAILLLLAIIIYKKIREKQEKNNGRE